MFSEIEKPSQVHEVLIVDDEPHCIDTLKTMLQLQFPGYLKVSSCKGVQQALKHIAAHEPDLIFLDVEMPHQNGFDLLKSLRRIPFDVVFTTAYEHYAIKAIKFNALDYLLKPFSMQDLEKAVERFREKRSHKRVSTDPALDAFLYNLQMPTFSRKKISLPTMEGLIFVPVEEIIRCESSGNYTKIYFTQGPPQVISRSLKEFEYLLDDMGFFRVHHSHLVNLQHVSRYIQGEGGFVKMTDGSMVEISRRKKAEFLKKAATL